MAELAKNDSILARKVSFSEQPPDVVYESDDDVEFLADREKHCGCVDGLKGKMPHGEACFYCSYVGVRRVDRFIETMYSSPMVRLPRLRCLGFIHYFRQ